MAAGFPGVPAALGASEAIKAMKLTDIRLVALLTGKTVFQALTHLAGAANASWFWCTVDVCPHCFSSLRYEAEVMSIIVLPFTSD